MDPLSAFRDCIINKKPYNWDRERNIITCGNVSFLGKAETAWKKKNGEFYILEAIVLFWQYHKTIGQYVSECIKAKIDRIDHTERKSLEKYLNGETEEGNIDPQAKLRGVDLAIDSAAALLLTGQVQVSDTQSEPSLQVVLQQEHPLQTRSSFLLCPRKDFRGALKLIDSYLQQQVRSKPSNISNISNSSISHKRSFELPSPSNNKKPKIGGTPIIIVPFPLTALINIYNVKEFLQNGSYLSPLECKQKLDLQKQGKPTSVMIERSSYYDETKTVKFMIIDKADILSYNDWDRVVAVFAQGVNWQFKNWRWSDPAELFSNISGYHLFFDDDAISPTISQWHVHKLAVNIILLG